MKLLLVFSKLWKKLYFFFLGFKEIVLWSYFLFDISFNFWVVLVIGIIGAVLGTSSILVAAIKE